MTEYRLVDDRGVPLDPLSALRDLWVDFRWGVLRGRPMYDHRIKKAT